MRLTDRIRVNPYREARFLPKPFTTGRAARIVTGKMRGLLQTSEQKSMPKDATRGREVQFVSEGERKVSDDLEHDARAVPPSSLHDGGGVDPTLVYKEFPLRPAMYGRNCRPCTVWNSLRSKLLIRRFRVRLSAGVLTYGEGQRLSLQYPSITQEKAHAHCEH